MSIAFASAPATRPRLGEAQLRALVIDLAARPEHWRDRVAHDPGRRLFTRLHLDDQLELWLVCWMAGHDTGLHDHGGSCGAVAVVRGGVREERYARRRLTGARVYAAGEALAFSPRVVHRVRHSGDAPAVTLHAYSPPLRGTRAYAIDDRGAWHVVPVGDDQELRPVPAPAS